MNLITTILALLRLKILLCSKKEMLKSKPLRVMLKTIFYRYWFILDLIIVAMHMSIVLVLVFPCFIIVLLSKTSYAPFSLYHESDILTRYIIIFYIQY